MRANAVLITAFLLITQLANADIIGVADTELIFNSLKLDPQVFLH